MSSPEGIKPARAWGPLPAPPPGRTWAGLMQEALREAEKAADQGEVPVGALLIAPDGTILARAHNLVEQRSDPTAHAEILVLRRAAERRGKRRLGDCVLVVTLEPCLMCVGAMVQARVAGLVFGAADHRAGAVISRLDGLELPFHNHRVWQAGGIAEDACAVLLADFFKTRRGGA